MVFSDILFREGLDCYSYEYFGVHRSMRKYTFRVWVPDAAEIYLVLYFGDSTKEYPMKRISDFGVWELSVHTTPVKNGICLCADLEDTCYRYKIVSRNGIYFQNDPYSFAFSPRDNCSVIATKSSFKFKDRSWSLYRSGVIFQFGDAPFRFNILHIDLDYVLKAIGLDRINYKQIAKCLVPFVKRMNYAFVSLSPVNQGIKTQKGNFYSSSLFSPEYYPGAVDDFKFLVDLFHKYSIGVILDFSPLFYVDSKYGFTNFAGNSVYNYPDENIKNGPEKGTMRFNLSRNDVVSYLSAAAFYWFEVFHIDGLNILHSDGFFDLNYNRSSGRALLNRYNTADNYDGMRFLRQLNTLVYDMLPINFTMTDKIECMKRGIVRTGNVRVGFNYGINGNWISELGSCLKPTCRFKLYDYLNADYILDALCGDLEHRTEPLIKNMLLDCNDIYAVLRVMKILQMTLPGKKFDIMGDGIGQIIPEEFLKRSVKSADEYNEKHKFMCYVRCLNEIYDRYKCLFNNDYKGKGFSLIDYQHEKVIAYKRLAQDGLELIVAVNLSNETIENIVLPAKPGSGEYFSVFNTNEKRFGGLGGISFSSVRVRKSTQDFRVALPPLSAVVFKTYS